VEGLNFIGTRFYNPGKEGRLIAATSHVSWVVVGDIDRAIGEGYTRKKGVGEQMVTDIVKGAHERRRV